MVLCGERRIISMDNGISFTDEELVILSNGILALIHNAGVAKTLVTDSNTYVAIDEEINKLVTLNSKICRRMEK